MSLAKGDARRIVLHIGAPKTGSSALQTFLSRQREAVFAQTGLMYPTYRHDRQAQRGFPTVGNGGEVARCVRRAEAELDDSLDALLGDRQHSSIISSENFWHLTKDEMLILRDKLKPYEQITVIFYARPQIEHVVSAYCQAVKNHGYAKGLGAYLKEKGKLFLYATRLRALTSVFGSGNVIVRPYLRRELAKISLVDDFLASIGCDASAIDTSDTRSAVNTSLDFERLMLILAINGANPSSRGLRHIEQAGSSRSADLSRLYRGSPAIGFFSFEEIEGIFRRYEAENESLVGMLNGDFPDLNAENTQALEEFWNLPKRPDPTAMMLSLVSYAASLEKRIEELEARSAAASPAVPPAS